MTPDSLFLRQPKKFWAHVRTISQHIGYTARGAGQIRVTTLAEIVAALQELQLKTSHVVDGRAKPTKFGKLLSAYFDYRASALNVFVEPRLMNKDRILLHHDLRQPGS